MSPQTTQFAICLLEDSQGEDLIRHKFYRVLPDPEAPPNYIRIVDESGEDYLYPARAFVFVSLPLEVTQQLLTQPLVG